MDELQASPGSRILDMGCGKGRHCIFLNELGFDVVGIDLSASNITAAQHYDRSDLHFLRHDMREPLAGLTFHLILNLFTSFGYFERAEENLMVLKAAHQMLEPEGQFVLDFLNAPKVIDALVPEEERTVDGTHFHITRALEDGIIVKRIKINNDPDLQFEERVQALKKEDLFALLEEADLKPESSYGSYHFEPYDVDTSDRLIIVAKRK